MQKDSRRDFPKNAKVLPGRQVILGSVALCLIAVALVFGLKPANLPIESPADQAGAMTDTVVKAGCQVIQNLSYIPCGHSVTRRTDIPTELIGKTRSDVEAAYDQYRVTEFLPTQVTMSQELNMYCASHLILMPDESGMLCVFENKYGDALMLKDSLDLPLKDLPEAIQEEVKNGKGFDDATALEQWLESVES